MSIFFPKFCYIRLQIEYFEYLLTVIPEHMEDTDRSFLENLLPWSPKLSENIQK